MLNRHMRCVREELSVNGKSLYDMCKQELRVNGESLYDICK